MHKHDARASHLCIKTENWCVTDPELCISGTPNNSSIDKVKNSFWMTGAFLSVPRYNWSAPLSHPSSCMLVNHADGPSQSQQSCKEGYKPWKWGTTRRLYASHTKITTARRPHAIIKRCTLKWYGHVSHSPGLVKTILQGTVKKGKIKGTQKKRWEDNMKERTCLEFAKSKRAVKNRRKWRRLVVTQQPREGNSLNDTMRSLYNTAWT